LSRRSFSRERERRLAAARRREQLRLRRATLAVGAAVGAFALAPAAAQAQNFEVNTLNDSATLDGCTTDANGCTLREAIHDATANTEPDTITFASTVTGTLDLTAGELYTSADVVDDITIQGPGSGLTISAGPSSRILTIAAPNTPPAPGNNGTSVSISGLTLSDGNPTSGPGGAIAAGKYTHLDLTDTTISGNTAPADNGGAISGGKYTQISLNDTTITGNAAPTGSGGAIGSVPLNAPGLKYDGMEITATDSTISGNNALRGGGIQTFGPLAIQSSTLSGNHATGGEGGAIRTAPKYGQLTVDDSEISGNTATTVGAGIDYTPYAATPSPYPPVIDNRITNSTISSNTAGPEDGLTPSRGGGIYIGGIGTDQGAFTVDHSTVSGNENTSTTSYGGGIDLENTVNGKVAIVDSTVSGNDAGVGGGVSIGAQLGPSGSISADNSTIAHNTVTYEGGGLWVDQYGIAPGPYPSPPVHVNSTIVGDNTAMGTPDDLGRNNLATSGGFQLSFSLVEAPTDAVDTQANSITGQDPQLGGLANNGGPTLTQLPGTGSPAIDAGNNLLGLSTDQRGQPRTTDGPPPNAGDGTDIGSVERSEPVPSPPVTPPAKNKPKCKKKHKKKHKRSADSAKKKHKKCKKKKKKKRH
jgi:hypothetical protein